MNRFMKKTAAVVSAAVLSICGCFGSFTGIAADTAEEITVVFDFGVDTSTLTGEYRTDGKYSSVDDFASYTTTAGSNAPIPMGTFKREGYGFSGWTVDNFYGYKSGETYLIPEDYAEDTLIFKAVWYNTKDTRIVNFTYNLELNGEQVERPIWLKDGVVAPGEFYEPNFTQIKLDGIYSSGLTDGERNYHLGTKFVANAGQDMVLTPIWLREITFTYVTGDVDRVVGNTSYTFPKVENSLVELAGADRFTRTGFTISGWVSDYDGQTYKVGESITTPGVNVTFTAVWQAKKYTVVFITGSGGANHKVTGYTDTTIVCPEPEHTVAGKYFAGWKDSEGDIYPAGSEYMIKGSISGISLSGVWLDGEEPPKPTEPAVTTEPIVTTTESEVTTEPSVETTTQTEFNTTEPITTTTAEIDQPTEETTTTPVIRFGDANCDNNVDVADAVLILQYLGNPDAFKLERRVR